MKRLPWLASVECELSEESDHENLYLTLAIVGAVVPYMFFFGFIASEGLNLAGFVSALFANGPAGGFTADLLISSVVFWIFMFSRPDGPHPWLFIALNLTIGSVLRSPGLSLCRGLRRGAGVGLIGSTRPRVFHARAQLLECVPDWGHDNLNGIEEF